MFAKSELWIATFVVLYLILVSIPIAVATVYLIKASKRESTKSIRKQLAIISIFLIGIYVGIRLVSVFGNWYNWRVDFLGMIIISIVIPVNVICLFWLHAIKDLKGVRG